MNYIQTTYRQSCLLTACTVIHLLSSLQGYGQSSLEGLKFDVKHSSVYENAGNIEVNCIIKNDGQSPIRLVRSNSIYNLKIVLVSPNAQKVIPYPYYPFMTGMFKIITVAPNEINSSQLDLSDYFPFDQLGEYRCTITKRVYSDDDVPVPHAPSALKGNPIDLMAPEIRFRVTSVTTTKHRSLIGVNGKKPGDELDGISVLQWYDRESSLNGALAGGKSNQTASSAHESENTEQSVQSHLINPSKLEAIEATSPETLPGRQVSEFLAWAGLAVACIGLLWLTFKKRN